MTDETRTRSSSDPSRVGSSADGPSRTDQSTDELSKPRPEPEPAADGGRSDDSFVFTYAVPFLGAVLLALGIGGSVLGAWTVVQPALGGCGSPAMGVDSPETTADMLDGEPEAQLERLDYADLSPAEQRAFDEAVASVQGDAPVEGAFENREALERGVIVTHEGTDRYATLVASNRCLSVDPLVFPLAITGLLLGLGVFAFMWYRNTDLARARVAR
ncbi:hypothetical protein [Halomontanus rarus]|uniref:hypothetical protein n=1 Tax=Halomontanus rarus TaxID=3034020 RepID=UPI0023E8206A|nr:hypothetical protein [Halovivax sp. TS33]